MGAGRWGRFVVNRHGPLQANPLIRKEKPGKSVTCRASLNCMVVPEIGDENGSVAPFLPCRGESVGQQPPERAPRGLEVVRVAGVGRLAGRPIGVCQKTPLSMVVA